jgi:hypothetical protein
MTTNERLNNHMRILRLFLLLGTLFVLAQILAVLARVSHHGAGAAPPDDSVNHLTIAGKKASAETKAVSVATDATTVELHSASSNRTASTAANFVLGDSTWQRPPPTLLSSHCFAMMNHDSNDTAMLLSQHFSNAPFWIKCYVSWHRAMRRRFPGKLLLTHPNAPGILIRYCDKRFAHHGLCGGLHDRLGNLVSFVYLANQTQRVLLYKWFHPLPLETFLQPHLVDWTVPTTSTGGNIDDSRWNRHRQDFRKHRDIMFKWKRHRKIYQDDIAARLKTDDTFRNERILVANADATVQKLSQQLRALGETDMIDDTSSFGEVYRAFFCPSSQLQTKLDDTMQALQLQPGRYVAAHARVRHPARYSSYTWRLTGKDNTTDADESGLPWAYASRERDAAIASAIHAIQCSRLLLRLEPEKNEASNGSTTVFFYSDSEDLVRFVTNQTVSSNNNETVHNSSNSTSLTLEAWHEKAAAALQQPSSGGTEGTGGGRIVARRIVGDRPTAHLDRGARQHAQLDDYLDTFLDLYIAINARCISYGFGNYAYFAAKISGTTCVQRHEQPEASVGKMWNQQSHGTKCPIPMLE